MNRYQQQISLQEIGKNGQKILTKARIIVVGAGGLASTLIPILAGAGIGFIEIYDNDIVKLHNLHRQTIFTMNDIGKKKVYCIKKFITNLNPECYIKAIPNHITTTSILNNTINNIDLVIDAADNFFITYQLSDFCFLHQIPLVSASVSGIKGYVGAFCAKAPSYRALFPVLPVITNNCNTIGVMGSTVATIASLQSQMVLNILLKFKPSPLGSIISCNFINWHIDIFRFDNAEEPKSTSVMYIDKTFLKNNDYIIELRNFEEKPVSVFSNVKRLSIEELNDCELPQNQRIVLVCTKGHRAIKAAKILIKRGFLKLAILADT